MEAKDYYNESVYLDSDRNEEALREIYYQSHCYLDRKNNDIRNNSFLIHEYDNYLNYIVCLLREFNIPVNSISYSIILDILIKRGTFSNLGKFVFDKNAINYMVGFLGINVLFGTGCCRHIAAFSSDVINKLNLMSDSFGCYITSDNLDNAFMFKGNHVINLIEYGGILYGYDPVHSMIFRFIDNFKLKSLCDDKKFYVYYKPYYDMIVSEISIDAVRNLMCLFNNFSFDNTISYSEYMEILGYARNAIDTNGELIRDFREVSKRYIKRINSEFR